ncbi:Radical SAM domain protein [Thermococcus chitonophagus]|uniref:Radical SAM domain protein n=2 Tax=Thermococcus chitonophagus TaxID=54262 RepID=A0A160VTS4_9EURY|nr:radical SAM protein [Thermococcus chitonophagus]CUX78392.1 Radical SAM domain protein [Thermococcus chitonophagus]
MMKLKDFIIGPSSHISSLCHSIVRGEVFTTCEVGCIYCYARWYRGPHGKPKPIWDVFKLISELGRMQREGLVVTPVRFSALSDPFQGEAKVTLKALKLAYREKVPVVVNTKLIPGKKHVKIMESLGSEGLLVFQVSLSTLENSKTLEPLAPSPQERLDLIRKVSEIGIPVIVRVQPFIPGWIKDIGTFVSEVASAGAEMIILEFLRIKRSLLKFFSKMFPGEEAYREEWSSYLPGTPNEKAPLIQPPLNYRIKVTEEFSREARKEGLAFSTCKEGLFEYHHPLDMDCCGMELLGVDYARRPTLWDLYLEIVEKGYAKPEDLWKRCEREKLLCGDRLKLYPRWFKRGFKVHEKRLESLLKKPHILERIAPSIKYKEGKFIRR